jgi:hypothetical protein
LIVIFEVEFILGFEIENDAFPAKSEAGVTTIVALVELGSIAGIAISICRFS